MIIRTAMLVGTLVAPVLLATPALAERESGSFRFQGTVGAVVDTAAADARLLRHVGTIAPRGYSHAYQWAGPAVEARPERSAVTLSGTLNLSGAKPGDFALLGLLDRAQLASGQDGQQDGAYVYIFVRGDSQVVLGLSDGNAGGGEIVQNFKVVPLVDFGVRQITFTVDGTRAGAECGALPAEQATADGCLTLQVEGLPTLSDSYGTVTNSNQDAGVEFGRGAVPGYDGSGAVPTGIVYDLIVSPARTGR